MSILNPLRAPVSTQDILAAHEAHGDDFMIIDLDTIRATQYAQYGKICIKRADDTVVAPTHWKLSGQGITTATAIKAPAKRSYAQIRVGVCQVANINDDLVETDNMKVMKLLCESYEAKMEQLKQDKVITDNKKDSRKQADGTMRPVCLISTKVVSPMDTVVTDRETGEPNDREHPYYWLTVPHKRFYKADEVRKESVHFNDMYYFDALNNGPDMSKPFMSIEYQPEFYNIDDFYHHPRTGKKLYKKLGQAVDDSDGEIILDNTNIHQFLTKGSAMIGNIKFEMVVTARGAKMELSLAGQMYVRQGSSSQDEGQDNECLNEFTSRYSTAKKPAESVDDYDEPAGEDF